MFKKVFQLTVLFSLAACGLNTFSNLPSHIAASTSDGARLSSVFQSPGLAEKIYMGTYSSTGFFMGLAQNNNMLQGLNYVTQSTASSLSPVLQLSTSSPGCVLAEASGTEVIQLSASTMKGLKVAQVPFYVRSRVNPLEVAPEVVTELDASKPIVVSELPTKQGSLFTVLGHAVQGNVTSHEELLLYEFRGLDSHVARIQSMQSQRLHPINNSTTTTEAQSYNALGVGKIPGVSGNWYALTYEFLEAGVAQDAKIKIGVSLYDSDGNHVYSKIKETHYKRNEFSIRYTKPLIVGGNIVFLGYGQYHTAHSQTGLQNFEVFLSNAFPAHMNSITKTVTSNFSTVPFSPGKIFGLPGVASGANGLNVFPESLKIVKTQEGALRFSLVVDPNNKEILSLSSKDGLAWKDVSPVLKNMRVALDPTVANSEKNYDVAVSGNNVGVVYINGKNLSFLLDQSEFDWSDPLPVNKPYGQGTACANTFDQDVDLSFAPTLGMSEDGKDETIQIFWKAGSGKFYLSTLYSYTCPQWSHEEINFSAGMTPLQPHLLTTVCGTGVLTYLEGQSYKMKIINPNKVIDFNISRSLSPTAQNIFRSRYDEISNLARFLYWDQSSVTYRFQYTYY